VKYSVFSASTPEWTPAETVEHLSAAGWDGVEWRITDQAESDAPGFWAGNRSGWPLTGLEDNLDAIRELTRGAGLQMSGIGGYVFCDDDENVDRMLRATAVLGAEQVRVVSLPLGDLAFMTREPSGRDYRELLDRARAGYARAAERAADLGVKVLIELHHNTITSSASAAMRVIDGLDPAAIGVIHDLGNIVIEGWEQPRAALQMLGPYLAHVHVKNVEWVRDADGSWHTEWASLTDGVADLDAYFAALRSVGYDGWVTVEDFTTDRPVGQRIVENLEVLRLAEATARAD
jgi:sugar phosphate isomerase/epimerase